MDPVAQVGELAPDFSLPDLEGVVHTLSEQAGRLVVINFWSAECPHSERADELLAKLKQIWRDRVVLWSVAPNANETLDQLSKVATERGLAPVLLDEGHRVADRYGAVTTPHFFVVDSEGVLAYAGAPDDVTFRQKEPTRDYLADAVATILEGRRPDPAETPSYGCVVVRHMA